jgi:hypothetical protein
MSITINGTTGISGVDGSSTAPAFQGTDTNTGLFYGTDIVGISTGGSERVRVDASGNVGIGTTSPTSFSGYTVVDAYNGTTGAFFLVRNPTKTGQFVVDTNGVRLGSRTNDFLALTTNDTERMRIDTSGNVFVNTTSQIDQGLICAAYNGQAKQGIVLKDTNATLNGSYMYFINSAGSLAGQIQRIGTTTVAYGTSSDYRLKENVAPITNALDKLTQLKPVTYTWKDTDNETGEGFIAHELQEVCPFAVIGEKDAVDAQGNPVYQSIDTSFLVATLTAAIQEQQTIINDLKARVTALEASNV